jgi:ATP-dependent Lon protease
MSSSELDNLIRDNFCDVCIDKRLSRQVASASQAIPDYVSDWLVSRYTTDGRVDDTKISAFLAKHLPDKKHKNILLEELRKGQSLKILDAYTVRVDITNNKLKLDIPSLDVAGAAIRDAIVEENPLLLMGNVWGSGTLVSQAVGDKSDRHEVAMVDFKPMQTSKVDLGFFIDARKNFTLRQWRELLIRSIGYNPSVYTPNEQMHLLTRLTPLIQKSINLIELAPKGTGKSYIYSRLSRHAWLISGGVVTRAQLFYNMQSKTSGVITRFDAVVLDEIQTIKFSDEGELVGAMKGYLEQGEFRVMQFKGSSDAGIVLLGNIPLNEDSTPKEIDLLRGLPSWLQGQTSAALIDRFHGIIPGWYIRKIDKECLCDGMALKADYFGEIFHALRSRTEYMQWVKDHTRSNGNLRDINAVERLAAAFLKLLFPDLQTVSPELFQEYCLNPAKELRKRVRKQLAISDHEYSQELAEIEVHI